MDIWCLAHADAIFVTTPKLYIHMSLDVPSKFLNAHIDHKILHIHTTAIGYLISSLILTPDTSLNKGFESQPLPLIFSGPFHNNSLEPNIEIL